MRNRRQAEKLCRTVKPATNSASMTSTNLSTFDFIRKDLPIINCTGLRADCPINKKGIAISYMIRTGTAIIRIDLPCLSPSSSEPAMRTGTGSKRRRNLCIDHGEQVPIGALRTGNITRLNPLGKACGCSHDDQGDEQTYGDQLLFHCKFLPIKILDNEFRIVPYKASRAQMSLPF